MPCPLCNKLKKIGGVIMARYRNRKIRRSRRSRWRRVR